MFRFLLGLLEKHRLLKGKTLGIDATTLEANAAMKSIVRKDDGKGWKAYLKKLAKAKGIEEPIDADLRRMDRARKDKKVSNEDWESPSYPEARIARMKDGTTHLACKAEHAGPGGRPPCAISRWPCASTRADRGDGPTGAETLIVAQANLVQMGSQAAVKELVADKGYHDNRLLAQCARWQVRTHIPERKQQHRRWTDKPGDYESAFRANRRRVCGEKGKRLQRRRSEECERSFAHVCETGGGRRSWLRGTVNVAKVHLLRCAARNLALLLRKCFELAKPRSGAALFAWIFRLWSWIAAQIRAVVSTLTPSFSSPSSLRTPAQPSRPSETPAL